MVMPEFKVGANGVGFLLEERNKTTKNSSAY
jgi:hypothetical protein